MAHPHTRILHVANGTCTTRLIESAGIPGQLSIWADPLHDGPVPAGLSDDELIDVRAAHLGGPDAAIELRRWRDAIAQHEHYDELILWYEHDLFDQLNLVQVLSWIRERVPSGKTVSLVNVGSFPGRPHFKGLGELSSNELASLLDTRQPVSDAQYALAARAWQTFREPSPEPLDALRRQDTSALPFLASSIARFLEEYPWTRDGLSRTERRLLRLAEAGPIDLHTAFPRMHEDERFYYVTDLRLAGMVEILSSGEPPLLLVESGSAPGASSFGRRIALTDAGRAVLAGRADRVALCGLDRWLGGVHLQGAAVPWRWDDGRQAIVRAA